MRVYVFFSWGLDILVKQNKIMGIVGYNWDITYQYWLRKKIVETCRKY
jgi:hypothetical protein